MAQAQQDEARSDRAARARAVIAEAHAAQARAAQGSQQAGARLSPDAALNQNRNTLAPVDDVQRAARLSLEERRTLRQQINDAGRAIYATPPVKP